MRRALRRALAAVASAGLLATLTAVTALAHEGIELTCQKLTAVDGDTIKCDGVNMRDLGEGEPFKSGYDTPEIRKAKCPAEKVLGMTARKRMGQLINTPGVKVYDSGEKDNRYKRPLVWVILPDGRSAGSVLISEGLAKVWTPDYRPEWCPVAS